jgi:hypothetical protein
MSSHLAVATVTAALVGFLARNVGEDFPFFVAVEARKPPQEASPTDEPTITVFCYQVTPNPANRNRDAPTRGPDGSLLTRPRAALDLHYLISFYGNETEQVPQRLLGSVVRALYEQPALSQVDIETAASLTYLAGSDLPAAADRIRFTATHIDIDDLYKLWSMLNQTPFALSLTYQASVVFIDGRCAAPQAARPVLRRTVTALPGGRPVVQQLLSAAPGGAPVEGPVPRGHTLVVRGSSLAAPGVWARVADQDIAVPPDQVRDDRLVVRLPDALPPGIYPLRVIQDVQVDPTTRLAKVLDSNALPFVRQPRILRVAVLPRRELQLQLDLPVRDDQRVQILLDELAAPADRRPHSYQLDAPFPLTGRADPRRVHVPAGAAAAARYLVRVQVDGAQSPLDVAADGTFAGPVVDLTTGT